MPVQWRSYRGFHTSEHADPILYIRRLRTTGGGSTDHMKPPVPPLLIWMRAMVILGLSALLRVTRVITQASKGTQQGRLSITITHPLIIHIRSDALDQQRIVSVLRSLKLATRRHITMLCFVGRLHRLTMQVIYLNKFLPQPLMQQ